MKGNMNKSTSLYRDVVISAGSVVLFGVFAKYFWYNNVSMEITQKPWVFEILCSVLFYIYMPFVLVCFLFGEFTKNVSQVDKIWPIVTPCFCWYITIMEASYYDMKFHHKLVAMSVLVTIWGARLTYQFYMKGGYTWQIWRGEEDYRWKVVRDEMPIIFNNRACYMLFNLGFICVYQLLLLFLITAGVMLATILSDVSRNQLTLTDVMWCGVISLLIIIESISDYQQQCFQLEKRRRLKENVTLVCSKHRYEVGFLTKGLFAYSRHPNFTAEQAIWLTFYLFSVQFGESKQWYHVGGFFNISIIGSILLIVLFTKSTDLTEKISGQKYALYQKYQRQVNRYIDFKLIMEKFILGNDPDNTWLSDD